MSAAQLSASMSSAMKSNTWSSHCLSVSVERGVDPRQCVLVAFGGGGPLHGCALADLLGMRRILVPPHAGVLSALGLAIAPERREAATSVMRPAAGMTRGDVARLHGALAVRARGAMRSARIAAHARVRYAGQGYELDVPFSSAENGAAIARRFVGLHRKRYGFALDRSIEVVAARAAAIGKPLRVTLVPDAPAAASGRGRGKAAPVRGPRVVTLPDATMVVARGWTARALPIGGWLLARG